MGQTSYKYQTRKGVAGGLLDISPYRIDSRINAEAEEGKLKFGMGAIQGPTPGTNIKVPVTGTTADKFEGVVMAGYTDEIDMGGNVKIKTLQTVGVLRYGSAWVRIASGVTPAYGEQLYLIITGANAGLFTNDDTGALLVNGRFGREVGTGNVASVDIYNQNPLIETE